MCAGMLATTGRCGKEVAFAKSRRADIADQTDSVSCAKCLIWFQGTMMWHLGFNMWNQIANEGLLASISDTNNLFFAATCFH